MHTLREHLHVDSRKSIFIADQLFELPTQLASKMLEIATVLALILMKQDDDNTDLEISDGDSEDTGAST